MAGGVLRGTIARRALLLAMLLGTAWAPACRPAASADDGASVVVQLDPARPVVGDAALEVRLVDAAGDPLTGASVAVEANMNHAGMVPVFADLTEAVARPGVYTGKLAFTMGGDWFLVVTADLGEDGRLERIIDVPGVRPD